MSGWQSQMVTNFPPFPRSMRIRYFVASLMAESLGSGEIVGVVEAGETSNDIKLWTISGGAIQATTVGFMWHLETPKIEHKTEKKTKPNNNKIGLVASGKCLLISSLALYAFLLLL
ncbi:unnamed protein product [Ceratitis capitata]|uniref:(Mediterranean fruit fly) hypothetical protein n=1 Tax=Ceratitis capitata TaxID=7213 RepID=A0A811VFN6_CERCA|nr:unnamed protein product [Ceratitis capitata]